jgi:hypothetical protein
VSAKRPIRRTALLAFLWVVGTAAWFFLGTLWAFATR